ncbi:MAG: dipeptide ABC transporter ATP-binding protein [Gammaproteobacteria bacterium]|nr:dipeptide ABC transporter ATP-binding protein [Gammaproteobacteria bacterium]
MGGALTARSLRVALGPGAQAPCPVDGVDLDIAAGECVVLLGESGCGKSLTALALMRLLPDGLTLVGGRASLGEIDLFALPEQAMRTVRGGRMAMIFQEPMLSLNPVMTIAAQVAEALRVHRDPQAATIGDATARLLDAVGLEVRLGASYPFQLSGGQRQRALIATMLAGEPELLIADEPTTALDVTVQAQILRLLRGLRAARGMSLLLITHDLDVARDMADRVIVMYAGQVVEAADRATLYRQPFHPYTRKLFSVLPSAHARGQRLAAIPGAVPPLGTKHRGCRFAARCDRAFARCHEEAPLLREIGSGHQVRCHLDAGAGAIVTMPAVQTTTAQGIEPASTRLFEVADLQVHFPIRKGLLRRVTGWFKAVDGVDLAIDRGETVALVGESGCGKTTLARAMLRLIPPTHGDIRLEGQSLLALGESALREARARMQIVFQDPFSSLNPRLRVGEILEEGLRSLRLDLDRGQRTARIDELLGKVGLGADAAGRYPHAFSGGQRQRIAIARALAVEPRLLVCDEPTSALDVSVQAQILSLLQDLQAADGLGYLFIAHNLPVVGYLADRIAVMYRGRIVEEGPAPKVMAAPAHPYTQLLLESAPGRGLRAEPPESRSEDGSTGCAFFGRCPKAEPRCATVRPELLPVDDRRVACHLARTER